MGRVGSRPYHPTHGGLMNFNRVFLVGNVTRDVEVRKTKTDLKVGDFGLAINRTTKGGGKSTCFIDITV